MRFASGGYIEAKLNLAVTAADASSWSGVREAGALTPAATQLVQDAHNSRPLFSGFLASYLLTVFSLAVAGYFWGKPGFNLVVVAMGWPHVFLGLIFNVNRLTGSDVRYRRIFLGLIALTCAIGLYHSLWPITTVIYLYFVFHAFRDEIFIYHQRRTGHRFRGVVFDASGKALLAAAVLLAVGSQLMTKLPAHKLQVNIGLCAAALLLTLLTFARRPRKLFDDTPGIGYALPAYLLVALALTSMQWMRAHNYAAPLFFVFLVVFHYWSWYVFSLEKIASRPAPRGPQPAKSGLDAVLARISTRRGFLTAVLILNLASFAGAYAYNVMHLSAGLQYAFDLKFFLYILVFHVTTSFVPKMQPKSLPLQPATP